MSEQSKPLANDFKTQRNELLGAWIAKAAVMELDRAASYMQYFVSKAENYNSKEGLAQFIKDEMRLQGCDISQSMAADMIEHYGEQVHKVMPANNNHEDA